MARPKQSHTYESHWAQTGKFAFTWGTAPGNSDFTSSELPPSQEFPHVTTEPSLTAAKSIAVPDDVANTTSQLIPHLVGVAAKTCTAPGDDGTFFLQCSESVLIADDARLSSDFTLSEFPPRPASPHVTTEPSSFNAAKARWFLKTWRTPRVS